MIIKNILYHEIGIWRSHKENSRNLPEKVVTGLIISKMIIFKPLLSNLGNSATVEEKKHYIPIRTSTAACDPRRERMSSPNTKRFGLRSPGINDLNKRPTSNKIQFSKKINKKNPPQFNIRTKIDHNNAIIEARIRKPVMPQKKIAPRYNTIKKPIYNNIGKIGARRFICSPEAKAIRNPKSVFFDRGSIRTENHERLKGTDLEFDFDEKRRSTISKPLLPDVKMTADEEIVYGDRFPIGYKKVSLLGKGGCALVWIGIKENTNEQIAVKQFSKNRCGKIKSDIESCNSETEAGKLIFNQDNKYPGIEHIAKYYETIEDNKDIWIIYELGGESLTKKLFEVKGEFYKGERLYKITHQPFFIELKTNANILKEFIKKILEALNLFQHLHIVHCDLKPDNLLIGYDGKEIKLKVIDFGSSFIYGNPGNIHTATPEYLAPECLGFKKSSGESLLELSHRTQPWSIDMWSLGSILLEIFTGFPQWLSLKSRAKGMHRIITGLGVFAVSGKSPEKIIQKQKEIVHNLHKTLKKYDSFMNNKELINLLKRMLDLNPMTRISPEEALNHPALA